jgi:hypothetical protein
MIGNGAGTLVTTGTERTARSPTGRMRLADQLREGFTDARARCGAALGSRQPVSRSVSAERMA